MNTNRRPELSRDYDPLQVDMGSHVLTLFRGRWWILAFTLMFGLVASIVLWKTEPEFVATAKLLTSRSQLAEGPSGAGMLEPSRTDTYRAIIESNAIAWDVIRSLGLDKPPHVLVSQTLLEDHLTIAASRETGVVTIQARMWTARLAADLANAFARRAVEVAKQHNAENTVNVKLVLKKEFDEASKRLTAAESKFTQGNQDAALGVLTADVAARLRLRGELLDLTTSIKAEQARLRSTREELAKQDRVRANPRSIDAPAAKADPDAARLELRSDALNPFINPVYESLNQEVAESTTKLAALEARRAQLVDVLHIDRDNDASVRSLFAKQSEIDRLAREYGLARDAYTLVASRYNQVDLQVASRADELRILDGAEIPLRQASPRYVRTMLLWLGVGFLFGCAYVLSAEVLADARRKHA